MIRIGDAVSLEGYFEVMDKNDSGKFVIDIEGILINLPEHLLVKAPEPEDFIHNEEEIER